MSLKRPRDSSFFTPLPPKKRPHLSSSNPSTPQTPYSYPYIPSTATTPYPSRPLDSPSNPFGRKRALALVNRLPNPTKFGQHLALRFQLIKPGAKRDRDGVYRAVQVPLSYTFKHLKCLISFLFDQRSGADEDGGEDGDEKRGHLFEVKKMVEMYSPNYLPGGIRKGDTWVRLSSVRDPYLYKDDWEIEDLSGEECSEDENAAGIDDKVEEWKWEAEEDFTLGNVWNSKDYRSGIVYVSSICSEGLCKLTMDAVPLLFAFRETYPGTYNSCQIHHGSHCPSSERQRQRALCVQCTGACTPLLFCP